ncbi:hypothetical protein NQ314_007370 [Rhamnusium bicolor]|uniref:Uncharacterized protein n=1 Tax=Rhamnusium bicolor TaxID=1586634 RepID=A0AAV8YPX0_9CUCU|nr:hypothetical protein NQ314_007370 [Rhamnusium bicolor]
MDSPSPAAENMSDDEFEVDSDAAEDTESILERLKQFAYYLVENVEMNLNFCLTLLEERTVPAHPNSIHTNVLSKLFSAIPKIFSIALNANSRNLHAVKVRKKAMQKLAKDASDRIFSYFLETEQTKNITRTEITKGVLFGVSKRNKIGIREGRTVVNNNMTWKTNKLYKKTGIIIVEERAFYKSKDSHTKKYGHRRVLPWEDLEDIKQNWEKENDFELLNYSLTVKEDLFKTIRDYIMSKNSNEEAKLERENYNRIAFEDRKNKHEEILRTFYEKFKELLDDLEFQYRTIYDNHNENKELLAIVSQKQDEETVLHYQITNKLEKIHRDINETKVLVETNQTLHQDIAIVKSKQDEITTTIETMSTNIVKEVIVTESAEDTVKKMEIYMREKLRKMDPGPRIGREVRRTLKKLKI